MDNQVLDFTEIKDKKERDAFVKKQVETLVKLNFENKELKERINHLEELLKVSPNDSVELQQENTRLKDRITHLESMTLLAPSPLSLATNEEELCKIEIARLFNAGKNGPLTMEEVKIFEIYTKTLLSIKGKSVDDAKKSAGSKQRLSEKELLQIALQTVSGDEQ